MRTPQGCFGFTQLASAYFHTVLLFLIAPHTHSVSTIEPLSRQPHVGMESHYPSEPRIRTSDGTIP